MDAKIITAIADRYPTVIAYLDDSPEFDAVKTFDFFKRTITRLVKNVYNGVMGGEFKDILLNLVQGQLRNAYQEGMKENGLDPKKDFTPAMQQELDGIVLRELDHINGYYEAIVDARVDQTSIDPLLVRADMWANRYNDVRNQAITSTADAKARLIWVYGETEHCETCAALNGIVAFVEEWEQAAFKPQNPPNPLLECGGWQCQCRLEPTKKRRSNNALGMLLDIGAGRML